MCNQYLRFYIHYAADGQPGENVLLFGSSKEYWSAWITWYVFQPMRFSRNLSRSEVLDLRLFGSSARNRCSLMRQRQEKISDYVLEKKRKWCYNGLKIV